MLNETDVEEKELAWKIVETYLNERPTPTGFATILKMFVDALQAVKTGELKATAKKFEQQDDPHPLP